MSETEEESYDDAISIHSESQQPKELHDTAPDWRKFILVVGKAGTGKSYALTKVIQLCVTKGCRVFVATPTGFLATL